MSEVGVTLRRDFCERPSTFRVTGSRVMTLDLRTETHPDDLFSLAAGWVGALVVGLGALEHLTGLPQLVAGSAMVALAGLAVYLLLGHLLRSATLEVDGDMVRAKSCRFGFAHERELPRSEVYEIDCELDGDWQIIVRARDGQHLRMLSVRYAEQATAICAALREALLDHRDPTSPDDTKRC